MRQLRVLPVNTLNVNPGTPAPRDRLYPKDIPDPVQRGIVTRYGSLDNEAVAADVTSAFADPNVISWQTSHSISSDDWTALAALITASIAPAASQLFPNEIQLAAKGSSDAAAFAGTVV